MYRNFKNVQFVNNTHIILVPYTHENVPIICMVHSAALNLACDNDMFNGIFCLRHKNVHIILFTKFPPLLGASKRVV